MKRKIGFTLLIGMLFFALVVTNCSQPVTSLQLMGAASLSAQVTPAPPVEDQSEIGSTDGILIMGIVIVAITSFPILFRKKKK